MAKRSFKSLRGLAIWLVTLSQLTFAAGCRSDFTSGSGGNGGSGSTAPGSTSGPNLGEILYGVLHTQLASSGTAAEVTALETDHDTFVTAVNQVLPTNVSSNLWPLVQKMLPLIDDGTIPAGVGDVDAIMKDLIASQPTVAAMADLASIQGKSVLNSKDALRLVGRLLSYPQLDNLAKASEDLIASKPDVMRNLQALLAHKLEGMTASTFQGNGIGLGTISATLLAPADTTGIGNMGAAAWAVHTDKNGNPAVALDPATGKVLAPFVDDGSGCAAVDAAGVPVDANGAAITLSPFGTDGSRDSDGRSLTNGQPTFQYFDAKHTMLGVALYMVGQLLQQNVPSDLVTVINATVPRVQQGAGTNDPWTGLGPQDPFIDLMDAQMEMVRRAPVYELLSGLSLLVKQNPAGFEKMVTSLAQGMALAKQSGFSTAGQSGMVNDLIPLLTDACKAQGANTSAVRAVLESFNTAQAQLQNLPQGFAIMMAYSDYGQKIPTDATHISAMQKLMEIMQASAGCSIPIIGGNMGDMYLDTLAGNGPSILGISFSINTLNSLVSNSFIRNLLCSQIKDSDVNALQDFASSGALDAFIPIAKAFSDRKETHLLNEIMLALAAHYPQTMTPNEPAIVKLLNSGAVNQLLAAVNQMSTITVPSNNENLIDVLADTVGALVDDTNPYTDRQGRVQKTLANLLLAPMSDLETAAQSAGVDTNLSNALGNLVNTLAATYTDANGNTRLVYNVFVSTLGDTLNWVAQQIPATAAQKSAWCDSQEQTMSDMLQSRDVSALVDVFVSINSSTNAAVFTSAISNLFTPSNDPTQDVFGSILQVLAGLMQTQPTAPLSSQQAADLAAIANFFGGEIDPAAAKLSNLMTMMQKMAAADDKLLVLAIVRNMISTGANGSATPPITTIMGVISDIRNADGGASGSGMTAQSMTNILQKAVNFMDDQQNGLPHLFAQIKSR